MEAAEKEKLLYDQLGKDIERLSHENTLTFAQVIGVLERLRSDVMEIWQTRSK